jgi:hypothetical protein
MQSGHDQIDEFAGSGNLTHTGRQAEGCQSGFAPRFPASPSTGDLYVRMSTSNPPKIAVARAVVTAGESSHGLPAVVLTLYRQPDGDGTYSLVVHRGSSEGRR